MGAMELPWRPMKAMIGVLAASFLLLSSCHKELKSDVVKKKLFQDHGLLGGYDVGVSWEDVKKNHDPDLKVRDEEGFWQLRYDLSDPGNDGFFINFPLDENKKVKALSASVYGREANRVVVAQVFADLVDKYDAERGKGRCSTGPVPGSKSTATDCNWPGKDGKPGVHLSHLQMDDIKTGHLDISFPSQ